MWKTFIRPAMIFIPFSLGILFPQAHVLNKPPINLVRWTLIVMMFISCLQLEFREMKPRIEHWRLLTVNILMGIVPFCLFRFLLPDQPDIARVAFFVGITPTATAAPVVVSFLHGSLGFALTGFAVTNIGISLALLGLMPLTTGEFTVDFIWSVAQTLLFVIALPFSLALLSRKIWPVIHEKSKKLKPLSFSLWSLTLFCLASVARNYFIEHPEVSGSTVLWTIGISFCLCVLNFVIGGFLSRGEYKHECSQLLGQKNTTFTMYLALQFAGPLVALGPIFYILWHNLWNAWQMYRCDRKDLNKNQKA
ncbi:MAG: hypothetical protein J6X55_04275 [Victivallales bacterium]|nr:hypothetical protein [Victivallales bacterium]